MRHLPEIFKTRTVANSRLFEIEQVELHFSNGVERIFERIVSTTRPAVMVVAMLDPQTVLLVREYHVGTERYEITCIKGLMEGDEDIFSAANREMKEEIGFGANEMQHLTVFSVAAGYMSSTMNVVLAKDLYEEKIPGDEPEALEVIPWKLDKLSELIERPDCSDPRTIAALFMIKDLIKK
jgi:ADP compounds hydrolase